ncbi:MAG: hypoxanthine phosphoribosyltransferase [Hyphomicrobiaceae bacterium]|nr:hypoxanthine phosphoribosyltransferase [Hyphomicrobiaceae bacterium]
MTERARQNESLEVIYSADEISQRLEVLAAEIAKARLEPLLVVAVLKGSFVFAADLIRALNRAGLEPEVDFITLSSYRKNRVSRGSVDILRDVEMDVDGRNVLLVDDVLDSGRTLAFAKDLLAARGARSIRTCVLLNKNASRAVNVAADFWAFECPNEFVVGYGMDVAHRYRELPFVGRILSTG